MKRSTGYVSALICFAIGGALAGSALPQQSTARADDALDGLGLPEVTIHSDHTFDPCNGSGPHRSQRTYSQRAGGWWRLDDVHLGRIHSAQGFDGRALHVNEYGYSDGVSATPAAEGAAISPPAPYNSAYNAGMRSAIESTYTREGSMVVAGRLTTVYAKTSEDLVGDPCARAAGHATEGYLPIKTTYALDAATGVPLLYRVQVVRANASSSDYTQVEIKATSVVWDAPDSIAVYDLSRAS